MTDFRALIADDAFAASFQSLGQYRTALLTALAQPEPEGPGPVDYRRWHEAHSEDCNTWSEQPTAPLTLRTTVEALAWANYCLARFGRPAIEPVPEPGEVAELVRRLRDWQSIPLLQERERIATLLQQLSAIEDLKND
jgi:hypothetical protein